MRISTLIKNNENISNREYIYLVRRNNAQCIYCPPHDIENCKNFSMWGKKKAYKAFYKTGKKSKRPRNFYGRTWYQNLGNYTYKINSYSL